MKLDSLIFGFTNTSEDHDKSTWAEIARHLVARLSDTLGQSLSPEEGDSPSSYGEGFSVDFRSGGVGKAPWKIRFRGTVGAQVIGEELLVRAWVFVYLGNVRLSVGGKGDVLLMKYVPRDQAGEWVEWNSDGWHFGEPGEFDAFEHFEGR